MTSQSLVTETPNVILNASGAPIFPSAMDIAREACEKTYRSTIRINETLRFLIKIIVSKGEFQRYHGTGNPPSLPAFYLVAEITRAPQFSTFYALEGSNAEYLTQAHVTCIHSAWYYYTNDDITRISYPYLGSRAPRYIEDPSTITKTQVSSSPRVEHHVYLPKKPSVTFTTLNNEFRGWDTRPRQRTVVDHIARSRPPRVGGLPDYPSIDEFFAPITSLVAVDDEEDSAMDGETPTSTPVSSPAASPYQQVQLAMPHVKAIFAGGDLYQVPGPFKIAPALEGCVPQFFNDVYE